MQSLSYTCTVEKESGRRNVFVIFIIFRNCASEKNIQSFITECYKYNYQKQKI